MTNPIYTMGIDVGGSYVKGVIMKYDDATGDHKIVDKQTEKIRKRDPKDVVVDAVEMLLERNQLDYKDIAYLASTGEGEMVIRKTGHFYSMTTHARGGKFFNPEAKTVVDMGGLYVRAIKVDEKGKVMDYKMTGQCASGSGQFIENISRYLGLAIEEVGPMSLKADNPEVPSGICAVLAETDVINLVSKGLSTPNIVKGINLSIAGRVVKLLGSLKAESPIALVGGMGMNTGMIQAVEELSREKKKVDLVFTSNPDAIYSGAVGAALWGGYRYYKLKEKEAAVVA
ncbi:MAG: benzoyl-CoA reductase subunit D [Bacteroidetes bacterium]|nr:MAG: benzoyl-CoA reductase subunit D [Bacteroidota bacterium]MBL1145788.1 benzoyl-CoA reductase subunit D [Bacteroidota bacterium]MCB0801692.1 benzoyl-CoA reductase subunit D [Flavobacteriales bacterium]NOG58582.1 benzoyl-CoA reductase subunit D [Bacteroidota bacterium]